MNFQRPLPLRPHFSIRPWGGNRLSETLGKELPPGGPYGESWELSDHPDGRSLVGGSELAGTTFGELARSNPRELLGRDEAPTKFPLLVKYIDAAGDLSVQVHPDDVWCEANAHDDRGKSECWYVMDCAPGAKVVYGYKKGVTEAQARRALAEGGYTDLLEFLPIAPGDFIAIPPRTVHAMLAGTLVCEIQQSSNTTFRLYDWDRQPPRELHIDKGMSTTEWERALLPRIKSLGPIKREMRAEYLLRNPHFSVFLFELPPGGMVEIDRPESEGEILNAVAGDGAIEAAGHTDALRLGDTWFLPAHLREATIVAGPRGLRVLITSNNEL